MIVAAGSARECPIPSDATVLDFPEDTILPGLIDGHVHFAPDNAGHVHARYFEPQQIKLIKAVVDAGRMLDAGFTGARDVGGRNAIFLKRAIDAGEIPGPRMKCSGLAITCTGGHEDPAFLRPEWVQEIANIARVADGADDCRKAVREQMRMGADFIKVLASGLDLNRDQFTYEELHAIIDESHKLGMRVAGHLNGGASLKKCLKLGIDTVEHGTELDDEDCDLMVRQGTYLCPTMAITEKLIREGPAHGVGEAYVKAATARRSIRIASFLKAYHAGVKIFAGSDYGLRSFTRHGTNAWELELMVEAGCRPLDAIVAATKHAAEAMGIGRTTGTLEKGKLADVIVSR
ncbi:MAG: metal-dependent hydrolase family protein, partial [Armatimonadota bacterium]